MDYKPQGLDFGNGAKSVTVCGLPRVTIDSPISLPIPQRVKVLNQWGTGIDMCEYSEPVIEDVWVKLDVRKNASTKAGIG